MQIKTTLKCCFTLARMSVVKKQRATDADINWTKEYTLLEM